MALILIAEDGSRVTGANSFATVADCDAYHEGHLYPEAWTAANNARKAAALVMATRAIQNNFTFYGFRLASQALEWPRYQVPRVDVQESSWDRGSGPTGNFYAEDELPVCLVEATCEMARALLTVDRTAEDSSKGIESLKLGQGALEVAFNPRDRKETLPDEVTRMLSAIGTPKGRSGSIRVVRVQ